MRDLVRCVVFDIDDTLYLERDYVLSGFRAVDSFVFAETGIRGLFDAAWREFLAGARGDIFDRALRSLGVSDPFLVDRMVSTYRVHYPDIGFLPDARRCLEEVPSGCRIGVISDGAAVSQRMKVRALGVRPRGAPVVLTGAMGTGWGKPSRRAYQLIEDATKLRGNRLLYVGDNPRKDFFAPVAMGWLTVRIRRPGSLHAALPTPAGVGVEIDDLESLPDLIRGSISPR